MSNENNHSTLKWEIRLIALGETAAAVDENSHITQSLPLLSAADNQYTNIIIPREIAPSG